MHLSELKAAFVMCLFRLAGIRRKKMEPEKPKLKSILKRPRVANRSRPKTSQYAKDPEHVRRTEQLYSTLEEARSLKEKTDEVLRRLKNFECESPDRRAVSIEAAQKMLSDVRDLNVKCLHEQRVLMERLGVKSEAFSAIAEMMSSSVKEVDRKRSELSEEVIADGGMRLRNAEEDRRKRETLSKLHHSTGTDLDGQTHYGKTSQHFMPVSREQFKISVGPVPAQLEALNTLIDSSREDSEERQKLLLAKKKAAKTRLENLRETLHQIKLSAEISTQNQIGRAHEAIQDCFAKNNELIAAKNRLGTLQEEVRAMSNTMEDFSCSRESELDGEYMIDQIQHFLELLKTVEIPEKQWAHLRVRMNKFCSQLTSALSPIKAGTRVDEEIQTALSGARLSEAIRAHAAKLLKRTRSKKCENVRNKSSQKTPKYS